MGKKIFIFQGLILILLVISALYLPKAMLLYSGYCLEKKRYLTTQEKFDIVVSQIIREEKWRTPYSVNEAGGKVFPEGGKDFSKESIKTLNYSSLEEFYAQNPNRCELVGMLVDDDIQVFDIPFAVRLKGRLNTFVRVFYLYDFDKQNDNQPIYIERYFGLSNCGEVWTPNEVFRLHQPKYPYG